MARTTRAACWLWAALVLASLAVVLAQETPIKSPTNPYFTPKQTFTPITTLQSAPSGTVIVMTGVGPSETPGKYTWNYTAPASTLQPTQNPALSSSLAKSIDMRSSASNLEPDPEHLQTVGSAAALRVNYVVFALAVALGIAVVQL
ncbi:hypothetical protein MOBT1_001177 [Malassezia obtusa]|uniref:Uncharacterized protein n=1 Tax=Malassezia obtusa TaxID=76774 RepID=A0AAF0IST9_9BASI|nr:hypothetical protein MOBT1_001177 [Malassezia obtusa]